MGNFTTERGDPEIIDAIDFMVERVWNILWQKSMKNSRKMNEKFSLAARES